jgi:hypothetical protein
MIPPMAAVLNHMLCRGLKIVLWSVLIAAVAELCNMEFANNG